jgi:hypothetical protein
VVPWKIHISQNLILSAEASQRDASIGARFAYANFYDVGSTTRLKIMLKLQKIPKKDKIDETPSSQSPLRLGPENEQIMALTSLPYTQDACGIGSAPGVHRR